MLLSLVLCPFILLLSGWQRYFLSLQLNNALSKMRIKTLIEPNQSDLSWLYLNVMKTNSTRLRVIVRNLTKNQHLNIFLTLHPSDKKTEVDWNAGQCQCSLFGAGQQGT